MIMSIYILLLLIIVTSDLRWQANTSEIYRKALAKMWLLRRMKASNLEPQIIIDFYLKEIRIVAEHGVAIWNSGLTKTQSHTIEKIQKIALKLFWGILTLLMMKQEVFLV